MNRFGAVFSVLLASTLLISSCCQAKQAYLEFTNDPDYPQLVTVSNVQYQLVNNKYLEFSGVLTIYEDLNDGTNVSYGVFQFEFYFFRKIATKKQPTKNLVDRIFNHFVQFFFLSS